jgi:hypothetical protein
LNPLQLFLRELPVKDFRAFCALYYKMKNPKAPLELVRNKFNVPPATLHRHWSSDNLQQYRDFVSNWDTAKDVTDLTRYVACSLSLKRRGHKPFLSHQDEVALAA